MMKEKYGNLIYEIPEELVRKNSPKKKFLGLALSFLVLIPFFVIVYTLLLGGIGVISLLILILIDSPPAYMAYRFSLQYNHFAIYEKGFSTPMIPIGSLFRLPKKRVFIYYNDVTDIKVKKKFPFVFTFILKNGQQQNISAFELAEYIKNDLRELRRIYDILCKLTTELRKKEDRKMERQKAPISVKKGEFEEILKKNYYEIENPKTSLQPILVIITGCFLFVSGIIAFLMYYALILSLFSLLTGFILVISGTLWSVKDAERGRKEILAQWKRAETGVQK